MKRKKSPLARLVILFGVLALTACSGQRPPLTARDAAFSGPAARRVIVAGFNDIAGRYIDPVTPRVLAENGLRGLATIDPNIAIEWDGEAIVLKTGAGTARRYPLPAGADATAWADLTVDVSAAAMAKSEKLRRAGSETIYQAIFDGVLSHLDAYSRYASARQAAKNRAKRDGFGGIGINYKIIGGWPQVTLIKANTPALRAGLRAGDAITRIDGAPTAGLTRDGVNKRLRGPPKSRAKLLVRRPGLEKAIDFSIERALIVARTVTYRAQGGIVYLKISGFNQRTAHDLLSKMKETNSRLGDRLKGVILDLRGNPGGLLKQSVQVADLFLTQGTILQTGGRHPDSVQHYEAGGRDMAFGKPLVVLLDGMSASAAEVTAAALQDRGRAVVVGTTSFGKGTVQTVLRLPNDGEITLTWSRLMAPSGYTIHRLGIFPTVCTSGVGGDGDNLFDKILSQQNHTAAVMAAWRRTGFEDKKQRQQLRAYCPPERRRQATDREIARRLIENGALYTRMLNLSAAAAAAR